MRRLPLKSFLLRALTALIAIPIVFSLVIYVPTGFTFFAMAAIGIGMWEFFHSTMANESKAIKLSGVVWGLLLMSGIIYLWKAPKVYAFPVSPEGGTLGFFLIMGVMTTFLFARGRDEDLSPIPTNMALTITGAFYLGLSGAYIVLLRQLPETFNKGQFETGIGAWLFLVFATTWLSDTGGYVFGKLIGGPKLYPSVSPKKTWAGLVGCLVGASGGSILCKVWFLPMLTWMDCVIIGCVSAVLGQIGDFSASLIKRAYGVKDFGNLLPGHGGMLDRIDALLFAGPFVFHYATWVVLARFAG